jgi:hypothetical protein
LAAAGWPAAARAGAEAAAATAAFVGAADFRLLQLGDPFLERLQPRLVALAQFRELTLDLLELVRPGGQRPSGATIDRGDRHPMRRAILGNDMEAPDEMT